MSIHINLSPEIETYIRSKVASGFYGNATEVIRDALRRMQSEEERAQAFRTAVAKGEEGEGIPYTSALMDEITQRALDNVGSATPIKPDVLP